MPCRLLLAVLLPLAACSGPSGARPDPVPDLPDAGVDAGIDATAPINALGRSCARAGGAAQGDCPDHHYCIGDNGAAWCTKECPGERDTPCQEGFGGAGVASCDLRIDMGSDRVSVCTVRAENALDQACTPSATSWQGTCPRGHVCIASSEGATTGTCTFACDSATECAAGFTGQGEVQCNQQVRLPDGPRPREVRVCSVRVSKALGRACKTTESNTQGDCPAGHVCVLGDGGGTAGSCTYACDPANDHCTDDYTGPGDPLCTWAYTLSVGTSAVPHCVVVCASGPDRACREGRTCDQSCPAATTCSNPLLDFGPDQMQIPPLDLGLGCL